MSKHNCTQTTWLGSLYPSIPAQEGLKEMMLSLHFTVTSPDFLLNKLLNVTFRIPHVHHSKEHSKPLAWPVETGCPCCLDIWPLQNKPLIFCGSLLASLQCGRVVWITSPICGAAGFQRPTFFRPLKNPPMFCLEVSHCGQHLCSLLTMGRASIYSRREANECPILRCAKAYQYGEGCCRQQGLGCRQY